MIALDLLMRPHCMESEAIQRADRLRACRETDCSTLHRCPCGGIVRFTGVLDDGVKSEFHCHAVQPRAEAILHRLHNAESFPGEESLHELDRPEARYRKLAPGPDGVQSKSQKSPPDSPAMKAAPNHAPCQDGDTPRVGRPTTARKDGPLLLDNEVRSGQVPKERFERVPILRHKELRCIPLDYVETRRPILFRIGANPHGMLFQGVGRTAALTSGSEATNWFTALLDVPKTIDQDATTRRL
jgi:hypothetical protein